MKTKLFIFFLGIFCAFCNLKAEDCTLANSTYEKGDYDEAAVLYEKALAEHGVSAGLLYNLGNTYYKLGRDGDAIVCYERAKKLDPSNKAINDNLHFLSSKIIEANRGSLNGQNVNMEPDSQSLMENIYNMIAVETRSNSWATLAVMSFILFLGGLAMYMFTPNVLARKTGFFSGITFFIFTCVFLIFSYMGTIQFNRNDEAVLMEFTTRLLEQPDEKSSPSTSPLHKGSKLRILDSKISSDGTEWVKVKLNSDNSGWVKRNQIEII